MAKRKKGKGADNPELERWRARAVLAMSERDAVFEAIGANRPLIRSLVSGYARLYESAHPIVGQSSDPATGAIQANRVEQPTPGTATARDRSRLRRIDRRLQRIVDEIDGVAATPIQGSWCDTCKRRVALTARFCDTCGVNMQATTEASK